MRAFFRTKKGIALLVTLAAAIAAVVAWAYFTASGSGTGTATIGTSTNVVLSSDPVSGVYPGQSTPVSVHIHNPGAGNEFVGEITGSVEDNGGCSGSWFTVSPIEYDKVVGGGSTSDTSASLLMNETNTNQDACQGKSVTIDWSTGGGGGGNTGGGGNNTGGGNSGAITIAGACPTGPLANALVSCQGNQWTFQCKGGFANVNGNLSDGCEVDLMTDPQNCGQIGTVVSLANATGACVNGTAVIQACNAGFADADHNPANGCEVDLMTDPQNCGQIGNVVSFANGTGACIGGVAVLQACNAGFADANHIASDGCEVNLMTDLRNCGTVGNDLTALPHVASAVCTAGVGSIVACQAGWQDANHIVSDGCETALASFRITGKRRSGGLWT